MNRIPTRLFSCSLLLAIVLSALSSTAQITLSTTTLFTNNNSSGTVTFNLQNSNPYPMTLTGVDGLVAGSGQSPVELYYRVTPISGPVGQIAAANGWLLVASSTVTALGATATQPLLTGLSFVIPANTTYGIAMYALNQPYYTMPASPATVTISAGGMNLITGTGIGYGVGTPPTEPINTPRGWIGILTFANPGPPCDPVTGVTVSNIILPNASVNWNAVTGAIGYEYAFSTSATPPATGTLTTATNATINPLAVNTNYYVHVRTKCNTNSFSPWTTVAFNTFCSAPPPTITPGAAASMCPGEEMALTASPAGGVWNATSPLVAGVSSNGTVTASNAGVSNITYTRTIGSCNYTATKVITVNAPGPYPGVISGNEKVCLGGTTLFNILAPAGVWTSHNPLIATVDAAGVVTPHAMGNTFIEYAVPSASICPGISLKAIEVVPSPPEPGDIMGDNTVCLGTTSLLTNSVSGGLWTSSNQSVATINSATGMVSGLTPGSSVITYMVSLGTCQRSVSTTTQVTIPPVPTVIHNGSGLTTSTPWAGYSWSKNGNTIPGANGQSYMPTEDGIYMVTVTDNNGCTGTAKGSFTGGQWLEVAAIASNTTLAVYPNPARTKVFVQTAGIVNVSVTSVDGKLLLSKEKLSGAGKGAEIDISSLASGAYFIRVSDASGSLLAVEKLMVQN